MKKIVGYCCIAVLCVIAATALSGCGGQPGGQSTKPGGQSKVTDNSGESGEIVNTENTGKNAGNTQQTEVNSEDNSGSETGAASDTLVVYFSRTGEQYSVGVIDKGNTEIVAEMIAERTGADMYEVVPADDHYPVRYDALTDIAKQEQNISARPEYENTVPDLSGYSAVFIGAPVWWGDWPMIMYTFFENEDLSGKTLIPFSTHAGSGLAGFDRKLAEVCPDSIVLSGLAVTGADAQNDREKVQNSVDNWLSGLDY